MRFIQLRSAPAENDFPVPERTTRRTLSSASMERSASVISPISTSSNALCRSGRFMVTSPIGPWRSMARLFVMGGSSHAEDAELRLLEGCIGRGREGEAEDAASVGRIDHAVVPEARAGVVGVALALVLLADRRLELLLFRGGPF